MTDADLDGQLERTWRVPASQRVALAVALGVLTALGGLVLWGLLSALTGGHGPAAGWLAIAGAVAGWGWLAGRSWTQSATLTPDTLLIRNVLGTECVPLDAITELRFRNGVLRVRAMRQLSSARGAAASQAVSYPGMPFTVRAIGLGGAYWSGRYCEADQAADTIAAAAGLPPLPSRKVRIGRRLAFTMLPASIALFAIGESVVLTHPGGHAWYALAPMLAGVAPTMFGTALAATLDHLRPAAARHRDDHRY